MSDYLLQEYSNWTSTITTHISEISSWIFNMIFSIIGSLINVIIVPVALFYFLKDFERIMQATLNCFPYRYRTSCRFISSRLDHSLGAYLRGVFLLWLCCHL